MFNKYEVNNNNVISLIDLIEICELFELSIEKDKLIKLFNDIDYDNSNYLDFNEFRELLLIIKYNNNDINLKPLNIINLKIAFNKYDINNKIN